MKKKKLLFSLLSLALTVVLALGLAACGKPNDDDDDDDDNTPAVTEYYVSGSWNNFAANDSNSKMAAVEGMAGYYMLTVTLTDANKDQTNGGHYYKVTNGSTTSYGSEKYELQPAPVNGSVHTGYVYIKNNATVKILFDSTTKKIYDDTMEKEVSPRLYGTFNNWAYEGKSAFVLTQVGTGGLYQGSYELNAVTEGDGHEFKLMRSLKYYIYPPYTGWGADEQYKFDGTSAASASSLIKPAAKAFYGFLYNDVTKETTVYTENNSIVNLDAPMMITDINAWSWSGSDSITFVPSGNKFIYRMTLPAYTGSGSGHQFKLFNKIAFYVWEGGATWEGGGTWGSYGIFNFAGKSGDGSGDGKGASYLKPTVETEYLFEYDPATGLTSATANNQVEELPAPVVFGTFNSWAWEGEGAYEFIDNGSGALTVEITLPAYTGSGSGYEFKIFTHKKFYLGEYGGTIYYGWGAKDTYKFDGSSADQTASYLKPDVETTYLFTFNPADNTTSYSIV